VVFLFLACALLTAVALESLGDDPALPRAPKGGYTLDRAAVLPNLVTMADIERTPPDSPERTVLSAYQAIQYVDLEGLRDLIDPAVLARTDAEALAKDVRLVGSTLGKPDVANTRAAGSELRARIVVTAYAPGATKPLFATTETLRLRNVRGRWLLADLDFLTRPAADLRSAGRIDGK
jgi:hypothetical protein